VGEYATFRGSSIKIGTCESMYYLRADQRHEVDGYTATAGYNLCVPCPDELHPAARLLDVDDAGHACRSGSPAISYR
jgi:hypothetical protein